MSHRPQPVVKIHSILHPSIFRLHDIALVFVHLTNATTTTPRDTELLAFNIRILLPWTEARYVEGFKKPLSRVRLRAVWNVIIIINAIYYRIASVKSIIRRLFFKWNVRILLLLVLLWIFFLPLLYYYQVYDGINQ